MVHYYCPFLQCQEISESVHLIDFVQTSVVCTLLTIIFTDASVLEESKQKMTDSNQVCILYVNLVLVSASSKVQSRSSHQHLYQVLYCAVACSRYQVQVQYPVLVYTSTVVRPGTCFCIPQYWYVPLKGVTCKSTQYWYIPILRPGTSY